jgi:hypothetical protein
LNAATRTPLPGAPRDPGAPPPGLSHPRTAELLRPLCAEVEAEIRPHLFGVFRWLVRGYLPQVWVFMTEAGSSGIHVDIDGRAKVLPHVPSTPDVIVEWNEAHLRIALATRDRRRLPRGSSPVVRFRTPKGRNAFRFLRARLGL